MPAPYTIGKLARRAGIPTSTVRYYERAGLLRADGRTEGNYRVYEEAALARLRFILAAKANGFALEDVRALLDFRDGRTEPCAEVQELIQGRLAELDARLEQMRHVRRVLRSSLKKCREVPDPGHCRVIDELTAAARRDRAKRAAAKSPSARKRLT